MMANDQNSSSGWNNPDLSTLNQSSQILPGMDPRLDASAILNESSMITGHNSFQLGKGKYREKNNSILLVPDSIQIKLKQKIGPMMFTNHTTKAVQPPKLLSKVTQNTQMLESNIDHIERESHEDGGVVYGQIDVEELPKDDNLIQLAERYLVSSRKRDKQ